MTTYETVMVVLTSLAFIVSIIGIIVKLLLIIIDNSAKKTTSASGKVWDSYFNHIKPKDNRLLVVPSFTLIIVHA